MRPIPSDTQLNAISLLQRGFSIRQVARRCSISKSTVHNIRSTLNSGAEMPSAGRPSKLSPQSKRICVRSITSDRLGTATAVTKKLQEDIGVNVSVRTVCRALREAGLAAVEKEKRPKLSAKNIRARLEFAKSHRDWTIADWKRVVWSDETKINRYCSDGRSWCWVRDYESRQPRQIQQTVKHGGGSVMIWGCMTAYGLGFMCKITGTMDQHLNNSILEDELLRTIAWYGLDPKQVIFQHDNDPKHRAASVRAWLESQEFYVLEWPAQSPDLNPIEHLWASLKRRLNQYETPPNGMLELWERIETEWDKIENDACLNLIESLPRRIGAVLKAKGMWTDY